MRTIAFLNKKGGVGKTSTCHHLAGTLARRGLRILLVDADPQASLTQGLLGPEVARLLKPRETIAGLFDDACDADMANLVRPASVPGVSLLAGSSRMDKFNALEPWTTGDSQYVLRDALREVAGDFDLTLIDCPPHIYLCAWSAMVAAQGIVVPLQAEDYGAQGVAAIQGSIDHVRAGANPRLTVLGFLLTMFQKSLAVHAGYAADLRAIYGDAVFETVVPHAKDFKESVMLRKPVVAYKPRSAAAKAIDALADELLARLDARVADEPRRVA
ncbi:chromosome partitioning protein [Singulisphaera sp. GP187]|uniref:ParA family protein n=1 Tax=Singulisphaera sp. GP187 TaxID=1882752 RepID=UPI000928A51F|nr:ParA family protein [Singulisphaera sp. GP187]SIO67980.1 chromosome partitioning protein [Singulisphaera sp. GP187]